MRSDNLKTVIAPAVILAAAALALFAGPQLPPTLSGLKTLGPYVILLLGAFAASQFASTRPQAGQPRRRPTRPLVRLPAAARSRAGSGR